MTWQRVADNVLAEATRSEVWAQLVVFLHRGQRWTEHNLFAACLAAMLAEADVTSLERVPTSVVYRYLRTAQAIVPLNATLYAETWQRVAEDRS